MEFECHLASGALLAPGESRGIELVKRTDGAGHRNALCCEETSGSTFPIDDPYQEYELKKVSGTLEASQNLAET